MKRRRKKSRIDSFVQAIGEDMDRWCSGRYWWVRAPLLVLFGYILVQHLTNPTASDLFSGLNLGIHELGHYVFAPFGEFMHILGGSLFQCLVPLLSIPMFLRQRDYFGMSVGFGWLSTNLFGVATYANDARSQELQLVSPGAVSGSDEIIHDWNWILTQSNMLGYDHAIAQLFRLAATISMLTCIALGAWLCWRMFTTKPAPTQQDFI